MAWRTKCDNDIHVSYKLKQRFEQYPELSDCFSNAIEHITLPEDHSFLRATFDFEHPIGHEGIVQTSNISLDNEVFFAKRFDAKGPSRISYAIGDETSLFSILGFYQRTDADNKMHYMIIAAFYGDISPFELWDTRCSGEKREESLRFWRSHAHVYDAERMSTPFKSTLRKMLAK